jgi:hypothetical protein
MGKGICPVYETCNEECDHKMIHDMNEECIDVSCVYCCVPAGIEAQPEEPWEGFDLDGTLAFYDYWRGADNIGPPIPVMVELVKQRLAAGKRIKIFTARASFKEQIPPIRLWLKMAGLPSDLEITNVKDYAMIILYDDRCVTVEKNTGRILTIPEI